MSLHSRHHDSPIGRLTLVASDAGLVAILWPEERPDRVRLGAMAEGGAHPHLDRAAVELSAYFTGDLRAFTVPLDPRGTEFQRAVWRALATIPYGETRSYAAIAAQIGRPTATRAVGAANGRNPLSIVAPCHRVIGSNGALTGFAGGLSIKTFLLDHERRHAA